MEFSEFWGIWSRLTSVETLGILGILGNLVWFSEFRGILCERLTSVETHGILEISGNLVWADFRRNPWNSRNFKKFGLYWLLWKPMEFSDFWKFGLGWLSSIRMEFSEFWEKWSRLTSVETHEILNLGKQQNHGVDQSWSTLCVSRAQTPRPRELWVLFQYVHSRLHTSRRRAPNHNAFCSLIFCEEPGRRARSVYSGGTSLLFFLL